MQKFSFFGASNDFARSSQFGCFRGSPRCHSTGSKANLRQGPSSVIDGARIQYYLSKAPSTSFGLSKFRWADWRSLLYSCLSCRVKSWRSPFCDSSAHWLATAINVPLLPAGNLDAAYSVTSLSSCSSWKLACKLMRSVRVHRWEAYGQPVSLGAAVVRPGLAAAIV